MNIDDAYIAYQGELEHLLLHALREKDTYPVHKELFSTLVPLWTLIHTFLDEEISINPTKELLLSHFSSVGDISNFVNISSDHQLERNYGSHLKSATKSIAFTSYFNELISDSLLLINHFHLYDYRGSVIALRCMTEDLYRHLYYKDNHEHFLQVHEYGKSEHEIGVAPRNFRQYLKNASYLQKSLSNANWSFNVAGRQCTGLHKLNEILYGRYSSFVHGSAPRTLNQFASNMDFEFDVDRSSEVLELTKMFVILSVSFLLFAHHDYFSRFNEATKRLVLDAFNQAQRQEIRKVARL